MAIDYQEFTEAVSRAAGLDQEQARTAAGATLTVLARMLDDSDRERLRAALPPRLAGDLPTATGPHGWDQAAFAREVAARTHWPAEQARLRAQAVLAALAEREPGLTAGFTLPGEVRALFSPPIPGGGVTGPAGHLAPLSPEEVAGALRRLPEWEGDTRALRRTIALPPENLEQVLRRIENLGRELGGGVHTRRDAGTAELEVSTSSVGAVTAPDVDIAARIDGMIAEAGAGIGGRG